MAALSMPLPGKVLVVLQEKITGQGTEASSSPFSFDTYTLTCRVNWVVLEVAAQQTPLPSCGNCADLRQTKESGSLLQGCIVEELQGKEQQVSTLLQQ